MFTVIALYRSGEVAETSFYSEEQADNYFSFLRGNSKVAGLQLGEQAYGLLVGRSLREAKSLL